MESTLWKANKLGWRRVNNEALFGIRACYDHRGDDNALGVVALTVSFYKIFDFRIESLCAYTNPIYCITIFKQFERELPEDVLVKK